MQGRFIRVRVEDAGLLGRTLGQVMFSLIRGSYGRILFRGFEGTT